MVKLPRTNGQHIRTITAPDQRLHALQHAVGFTADDLHANQGGYLSRHQLHLLRFRHRQWRYLMIAVGFFDALLLGLAGLFGWPLITLLLLGLISIGFYAYVLQTARATGRGINTGNVLALAGPAHLKAPRSTRSHSGYLLTINAVTFIINRDVFLAIRAGDAYRLYYLPDMHLLLSIEPALNV